MFTERKIYKVLIFINTMINKTEQKIKGNVIDELELENAKLDENVIEDLRKRLEDANFLAEERLNHLKYLQADFDNYRKKFDKEKEQIIKLSNENLIEELIIILDDFDNSIKLMENEKNKDIPSNLASQSGISNRHSRTESDTINWNVYKEGILRLHKKLFNMLQRHGLKHIEALGKKFDPYFHEALIREKSDKESDIVIEEIQKGYLLDSKVIRYTKVKISENNKVEQAKHFDTRLKNDQTTQHKKDLNTEKINQ